jgi:NDP-sugar pyrophosphorylase family protein
VSILQILMPMGGLGRRFRDVGVNTPKPLIPVLGVPMFKRALASFDAYEGKKTLIVVVREDADREFDLAKLVTEAQPSATVVMLDHDTRGAVETCMAAEDVLDPDLPLVIMDCDIAFSSPSYFQAIEEAVSGGGMDGLLLTFNSTDPRYSFAELDETGRVIRTAEKEPISANALMGAYFFTRAATFLRGAKALMDRQISEQMKEYYVSLVFNELIESGLAVGSASGDLYSFGTPEELARFEAGDKSFT